MVAALALDWGTVAARWKEEGGVGRWCREEVGQRWSGGRMRWKEVGDQVVRSTATGKGAAVIAAREKGFLFYFFWVGPTKGGVKR